MSHVRKAPKPYPAFPLFAHANGSWKRKIERVPMSFGPWRWGEGWSKDTEEYVRSWKAALDEYNRWCEARAKGIELAERPERITLTELVDLYLSGQEDRVGSGIEPRTFAERRAILTRFRDAVGGEHSVGWLEDRPDELLDYLKDLDEHFGFHRYNAHVKEIKACFIAAEHPLTGIMKRPFRLRPLLKRKQDRMRRREKRLNEALRGKLRWRPDELRAFFAHASQPLRAQIGLAYFAGFGNSDCADVPLTALNFSPARSRGLPDGGWSILNWIRPKTEIDRAAVLPGELAKDLLEVIPLRPKPAEPKRHGSLVFLTPPHPFIGSRRGGLPIVRDIVHTDEEGKILKTVRVDALQKEFERLRDRLSKCPEHGWLCKPIEVRGRGFRSDKKQLPRSKGKVDAHEKCPHAGCGKKCEPMRRLGFYAFRHTGITFAIPAASLEARVLFEGHAIEGVRAHYVEELDTAELIKIARRLVEKRDEPEVTHSASPSAASTAA